MGQRSPVRIVWTVAAIGAALVAALLVVVHTPPVRSRVQSWVRTRIAAAFQLDLQSSALEYNLLTRRVTVTDVRLSALGHEAEPFFAARRVTASLPWAIFRGIVRLSSVEVDDGRVLLVRENGEIVNLPPSSGAPPPLVPRRLDVRGLTLRNFQFDYADRTGNVDVNLRGLHAELAELAATGAAGPIGAESLHARVGDHATTSGAIAGELAFDGSNVTLTGFTVPLPEGTVVVDGPITRVLDDVTFDLALKGTLDVARAVEWAPPPVPVSGDGSLTGTMRGRLADYELRVDVAAPALVIGRAAPMPLTAAVSLTSARALVESFTLTAPGERRAPDRPGTITGSATYSLGADSAVELTAAFRDLDLDVALAAYQRDPLIVAAWQEGTATLTRAGPGAPLALRASGRSTPLVRRNRVTLDGTWDVALQDERWNAGHDHRLLDTVRAHGRLSWPAADDPAQAPLDGPLDVEVGDVGRAIRAARRSGIEVAETLEQMGGPATAALRIRGTLDRPVVDGGVESSALVLPSGAVGTASADLVIGAETVVPRFELTAQGTHLTGEARVTDAGALSGSLAAEVTSLPEFARPWAGDAADGFTGTMQATATLGGTTARPDIPWRVESTAMAHGPQPIGTLAAAGRLLGTDVQVERARLDQGADGVDASGRYDYESGAYEVTLRARGVRIGEPFVAGLVESVVIDGSFDGSGTVESPAGTGLLRFAPEGGRLAELVGVAETGLQLTGGRVETRTFVTRLRTLVDAAIDTAAPYAYRGTAVVSRLDVEPLSLMAGALDDRVVGTVGLSASFQGTASDTSSATAFVNLQDVAVTAAGVPITLERPARITLTPADFSVDDLSLRVGAGQLTASGRLHDPVRAPLAVWYGGPVGDLVTMASAFGVAADVQASGDLNAWWESTGGIENASATATLRDGRVVWQQYPPIEALEIDAAYDGTTVAVKTLKATWQNGGIEGTAQVPLALLLDAAAPAGPVTPGRVDLTLRGLTQDALAPWVSADVVSKLEARVSATVALDVASAEIGGLSGSVVFDEAAITAAGVPVGQARPTRLSIAKGVVSLDDVAFGEGDPVVLGGRVTLGDTVDLDVSITGDPGLRALSVLSPQLAVDGSAKLDLHITGTSDAPRFNGRIDLVQVEAVMRDPRVIASEVAGAILFDGDRIVVPGLRGSLNGGVLDAFGDVRISGMDAIVGDLSFQAQGVSVEYPRDVDTEIDALLILTLGQAAPMLRGDVRVLRGSYRATVSLPALVAFNRAPARPRSQASVLDEVRLDISVSTQEDLLIDNNYGRFEAGADLRLQGTIARPGVTGRAELREGGEVFVLGGLYTLNDSNISFTNPNAIEPDMNISMATRSSGYDTTLTISGTLDRIETNVTSSDPNADQTLMSVLLGGNALSREDALALFSGELLGVTGRAIGLDSLRVERGFDSDLVRQDPGLIAEDLDPSTRLTMSKRLRANVEVILSQDLRASGGLSAVVSYQPVRNVELRATSRDNNDRAYTVRHEISFGGARLPVPQRRVLPDVAAVGFAGAGADEPALRGLMKLEPGDRYDFVEWRDDIDRMERWYHERGRLQARVRGSRTDTSDGRPQLLYRVTPGPETELRVEGLDLSRSLRSRIEEAWSGAVFDRFLIDEVRNDVALDLVRNDVIGATVEVTMPESSPDRKVMLVRVEGGTKAGKRELRYTGLSAMTPGTLNAVLQSYALSEWVWIEPLVVVDPFIVHYAESGYRAIGVTAERPRFEGTTAVIDVAIDEGPVTRLTEVTYEGVDPSLQPTVETAGRLTLEQPYRIADVDQARRQIEAAYRRLGYNDVVVRPQVAIDDAAHSATVAFAVTPGREQRLAAVIVQGTTRSRPESVERALGLKPGTPVDFQQWAQARKRVFDTNVFRQVEVTPEDLPGDENGPEQVNARVTVSEWPTWRLRYGLQLNDRSLASLGEAASGRRQDLGVVADIQNRNVLGRGFTFGLYGRVERRLYSNSAYLTFPTFFGRALQTNVFASRAMQDRFVEGVDEPVYRQRRELVSIEQRLRRTRTFEITYGYRLTNEVLDAFDPDDPFLNETLIGRFTGSVLHDRRDDPFDATRGWFSSAAIERVSEFRGGSDSIKMLGTLYYYRTAGPLVVASAARLGVSFLDPLVLTAPFYVGGAVTVRGYAEQGIGPRGFSGLAQGGNAQLILNQEVRMPIRGWLKGVAFVDAGNVFTANRNISLGNLKVGYGVGLRLDTPFSLLRLDFGIPAAGGAKRFYFGIGQAF